MSHSHVRNPTRFTMTIDRNMANILTTLALQFDVISLLIALTIPNNFMTGWDYHRPAAATDTGLLICIDCCWDFLQKHQKVLLEH